MAQIFVTPGAPSNTSATDSQAIAALGGKAGELIDSALHETGYTSAYRGRTFIGGSVGAVIPVNAASVISTFTLYNPLGSGVNVEMLSYDVGITTLGTTVIGSLCIYQQTGLVVAPTNVTTITPVPGAIGSSAAPQAKMYSSASIAGTPTFLMSLGITFGLVTAGGGPLQAHYEFKGRLIVPPGSLIITTSQGAAQTTSTAQTFIWSEYPI